MTNEDRQRTMEFILEQQAQFAVNIQRLEESVQRIEEERVRDRPRLARLEESFLFLVEWNRTVDSRLDRSETKTSSLESKASLLEANMATLAAAQAHADDRLSALIDIVRQDRDRPRN